MNCPFCNQAEIGARIAQENEYAFAMPTNIPITPGHLLIIPKRHAKYYEDLSPEEKSGIEELRLWAKHRLQKVFEAEGFNYAINEEEIGGQSVPHFHLHIVPRKQGDTGVYEYEPRQFLYRPGSRVPSPEEELVEIARILREK